MSGNGDTNMSSPSTPGSDMFPAANDQLPSATNNTSPPNSQEAQVSSWLNGQASVMQADATTFHDAASRMVQNDVDVAADNAKTREPGWGWQNKQAQEEYSRAFDMTCDKDFPEKLAEFGDVLEER